MRNKKKEDATMYFPIGTQVNFLPVKIDYIDYIRQVIYIGKMQKGVIVGIKDAPLGRYRPGGVGGFYGEDYDPPYLEVKGSVRLYRIRQTLLGAERLAKIEDVSPVKTKFILPLAGRIRQWLLDKE